MKITVMGLGYIGLPTAITLAEAGFEVCGFDVNKNTIETLQGGHIHIVEPGLQEAFEKAVAHGHLHFSEELGKSDVFYISVPTPFFKDENGNSYGDWTHRGQGRTRENANDHPWTTGDEKKWYDQTLLDHLLPRWCCGPWGSCSCGAAPARGTWR